MIITKRGLLALNILVIEILFLFSGCNDDSPTKYDPPSIEVNFPPIDQYPAFSPDGNRIMYYHLGISKINSDGSCPIDPDSAGLWVINIDGTNQRLILKGLNIYADWSPGGDWIVINQGGQIFKAPFVGDSINTSEIVQLTFEGRNFFPNWSPDGQWIAYDRSITDNSGSSGVWIMKSDGSQKQRLLGGAFPSWHPNSRNLIVNIGSTSTSIWKRFVIYYPFELTSPETLNAIIGQNNFFPKYSIDGNRILFQSQAENEVPQIWVMNADATNPQKITTYGGTEPDISPNQKVAYIHYNYRVWQLNDKENGIIWIMDSDGSNKQQLTFGPYP
jgi:Tol biopolymer transport system component